MPATTPTLTAQRSARSMLATAMALVATASCGGSDSTAVIPVTALRFSAQPANVAAGTPFSVTVELVGASGARSGAPDPVKLTVLGGGTFSGPATVAANGGVAKFDGLAMTVAASNIQLVATDGTLSTASAAFAVTPGAADLAHSVLAPAPCTTPPNVPNALLFTFKDAYGNPLPSAAVTLATSLTGSTLTPSSGTTDTTGSFAANFQSATVGSASVSATVAGKHLAFTPAFVVATLGAASPMSFPGTVNGSIASGTCVGTGLPSALYSFTMPAAGGAAFTVTSAFTPVFEVKPGQGLTNVQFTSATSPVTQEWLLPSGPLQFAIGTLAGTGSYSISGAAVSANSGCPALGRGLIAAGTYTGQSLGSGDCLNFYQDGSFDDEYFIQSPGPCTLTLRTTAFNNYFAIFDGADRTTFIAGSQPPFGADAVVALPSCQNGDDPLDIVVNSLNPGETGAYTLIVAMQASSVAAPLVRAASIRTVALTARGVARMPSASAAKHRK